MSQEDSDTEVVVEGTPVEPKAASPTKGKGKGKGKGKDYGKIDRKE